MIIQLLLDAVYALFYVLTEIIDIGTTPAETMEYLVDIFQWFSAGLSVLSNYIDWSYLSVLLSVVIAVDAGLFVYHLVIWILRKIPMLGIE